VPSVKASHAKSRHRGGGTVHSVSGGGGKRKTSPMTTPAAKP
jgi:hypothetical protein